MSSNIIPAAFGVIVFVSIVALWQWAAPGERVCVQSEERVLPLFGRGPKHHINGDQIGWVKDTVCAKWAPKDPEAFVWPEAVY